MTSSKHQTGSTLVLDILIELRFQAMLLILDGAARCVENVKSPDMGTQVTMQMTAPFIATLQRNHLVAAYKECVEVGEIVRPFVANGMVDAALEDCQHANNFNTPIKA